MSMLWLPCITTIRPLTHTHHDSRMIEKGEPLMETYENLELEIVCIDSDDEIMGSNCPPDDPGSHEQCIDNH